MDERGEGARGGEWVDERVKEPGVGNEWMRG